MKKTVCLLIIICLLGLVFVSCEAKPLSAPTNLNVSDGILSWDKVANAEGYVVKVNESEYKVSSPFLELTLENNNDYEITVKAIGEGKYKDSDFSETYFYSNKSSPSLKRLTAPNIIEIDGLGNIYWSLVSNSKGYKIFKNNILFATVNDAYTTTYKIEIEESGTYSIQVQAIGDNENFSDSAKSNVYKLVIDANGKPNLPSLSAPEIVYNAESESLEWKNVRNAKEYFVYLNDNIVAVVPSSEGQDNSYRINPNFTTNVFSVVAVGDNISYGVSRKSNSITFPLVASEPPTNLRVQVLDGAPLIVWDEVEYSRGYILEINSRQERLLTNSFSLNLFEDGDYAVRVQAVGDNLFYSSTLFSEQISVKVENGAIQNPRLAPPDFPRFINNVLSWESVAGANGYEIVVETPYDDTVSTLYYTTEETSFTLDSVFEETVLIFYVRAFGDGYTTSLFSNGLGYVPNATKQYVDENGFLVTIQGEQYYFTKTPSDITYDGHTLSWSKIDDASGYLVFVDNQILTAETNSLDYSILGSAVVSVSALTEKDKYYPSPKSVETYIVSPKRLKTPEITLNKTLLSWESINGASEYTLFANGEQIKIAGNFVDLKSVLKIDGTYALSLVAVSQDSSVYADSLKSRELSFVVDYGEYGTKEKPYLIKSYEDFNLMKEHPDAYFKIDVGEIDLNNASVSPLFEDNFFTGNLNGNNAVIKNFSLISTNLASGFFGTLGSAEIYDLTFKNVSVSGGVNVGVISHGATDTKIENIKVLSSTVLLSSNANIVGGAFGRFKGEAKNIFVDIKILKDEVDYTKAGLTYIGGFAGVFEGNLSGIVLAGEIETPKKQTLSCGFLAGFAKGNIDNLTATNLRMLSSGDYNGLVAGVAEGEFIDFEVDGSLSTRDNLNGYYGLFGKFQGKFEGEANLTLTLVSEGRIGAGGFAGYVLDSNIIADIACDINVSCSFAVVGGFVGEAYGEIEYDFQNEINILVNSNNGYIGGVFGRVNADISDDISGNIQVNVNENEKINLLIGSLTGSDPNKCLNTNVVLSGNVLDYIYMKPSGNGTKESPFLITNEEEFLYIEKEPTAYFELLNDIVLNRGFCKDVPFSGHFEGNFRVISNIFSDSAFSGLFGKTENAEIVNLEIKNAEIRGSIAGGGLAGYAKNTKIEFVCVEGSIANYGGVSGGLVGYADNCEISNCGFQGDILNVSSEVSKDWFYPYQLIGGVVGMNHSHISDTFAICDFSGESGFFGGGFSGQNFGSITDSYAVGKLLTENKYFAGFAYTNNGNISSCYSAFDSLFEFSPFASSSNEGITNCKYISPTFVEVENSIKSGVDEVDNATAIENGIFEDWNNVFGYSLIPNRFKQNVESKYNDLSFVLESALSFNLLSYINLENIQAFGVGNIIFDEGISYQNGIITVNAFGHYTLSVRYRDFEMKIEINFKKTENPDFEFGDGTFDNPYEIKDFADLEKSAEYANAYFKLTADIEIERSINNYASNLDGQGFSLKSDKRIFDTFSGTMKNLSLVGENLSEPLILSLENAHLENVEIRSNVVLIEDAQSFGIINEITDSSLSDISLTLSFEGKAILFGGLSSQISGISEIKNISVDLDIKANAIRLGGLFGESEAVISKVSGSVKIHDSVADYIGGIVADTKNIVSDINVAVELTTLTAKTAIGGVCAEAWANLENCQIELNALNLTTSVFGGIVGNAISLNDCFVSGNISLVAVNTTATVGGIAGVAKNVSGGFSGEISVLTSSSLVCGLAVGECINATVEAEGGLTVKSSSTVVCLLKCGTLGMGNLINSNVDVSLSYLADNKDNLAFFGGAVGEGGASDSVIAVNVQNDSVNSKLYLGGAVGCLNGKIENNVISGDITVNETYPSGTVCGYSEQEKLSLIGENQISLSINSSEETKEIGYIETAEIE